MNKALPVCLTKELEAHLRALKQQTGVGLSEIMRRALRLYFETVGPAPGGLGLIAKGSAGQEKESPASLSRTNEGRA